MVIRHGCVQEEAGRLCLIIWNRSLFTGMISACGCTIEKDGKRLFNKEMTTEAAWHSVEVLRKYGMIPVMEGADWMYYDKDEYNTDINWYADLITKALGAKWRPVKGYEHDLHINKISSKIVPGSDPEKACAELEDYYEFIGHVGEGLAGDTIEMIPKGFFQGCWHCGCMQDF